MWGELSGAHSSAVGGGGAEGGGSRRRDHSDCMRGPRIAQNSEQLSRGAGVDVETDVVEAQRLPLGG